MPRPKNPVPTYLYHKPTGQAYVRLPDEAGGRRTQYLGPYDSPESRVEYARVVAAMSVSPPTPEPAACAGPRPDFSVNEVLLAFWQHAERHYRRADGSVTNEVSQYRQTFRLLKAAYGSMSAWQFGPKAMKALRQQMIEAGWNRRLINQRVGRVRRVFKWAASEELLPAVYQSLATVGGLQAGRTEAKETGPVLPVADDHVRATLPFLRPAVRVMAQIQLLTGMRPGEVCQLRPCDLDMSGGVWLFRPGQYKTRHREKPRVVAVGPRAQALLAGITPADPTDYYFSPRRVVAELHAERAGSRRTAPRRGRAATGGRKQLTQRRPSGRYTVTAYGRAVRRAVERANARRERLAGAGNFDPVPRWFPNQLRHSHGTRVRHRFGLEAAQVALGHERADVTQVYAEKNQALAIRVAADMG